MHPSSRAVNSARKLGPWTRVVETDFKWYAHYKMFYTVMLHMDQPNIYDLRACNWLMLAELLQRLHVLNTRYTVQWSLQPLQKSSRRCLQRSLYCTLQVSSQAASCYVFVYHRVVVFRRSEW